MPIGLLTGLQMETAWLTDNEAAFELLWTFANFIFSWTFLNFILNVLNFTNMADIVCL